MPWTIYIFLDSISHYFLMITYLTIFSETSTFNRAGPCGHYNVSVQEHVAIGCSRPSYELLVDDFYTFIFYVLHLF